MAATQLGVALALLAAFAFGAAAEPVGPLPASAFFANPTFSSPRLSPDGKRLAVLHARGDLQVVLVRATGDPSAHWTPAAKLEDPELRFSWLEWKSARCILLGAEMRNPDSVGVRSRASRLFALDPDQRTVTWLGHAWPTKQAGMRSEVEVQIQDRVLHWLPADPQHVLIAYRDPTEQGESVRQLNVESGSLSLVKGATRDVFEWKVDHEGRVRAGEDYRLRRYSLWARPDGESDFEKIQEHDFFEGNGASFAGFAEQPHELYLFRRSEGGRATIARWDLVKRAFGATLFSHAQFDAGWLERDEVTGKTLAVVYATDGLSRHFLDEEAKREYAALEKVIGGWITIEDQSLDRRFVIVSASSDTRPTSHHLYDRSKREAHELFSEHPQLSAAPLSAWSALRYPARDGAEIPAYLALPPGAERRLPVIVLVHGGPSLRVVRAWDPEVQFFASRGFAVFQPNFRGSDGYGQAFREAGYRQWGLAMQDDVTDGVRWLIEQGIADPQRIGIYGASYGGYAALMGLVKTPELFRAGASYAGIASIPLMLADDEWYMFDEYNKPTVGGGWDDRERLAETSPLESVGRISAPVLLGHGENDPSVHVKQSQKMAEALREAGKTVEYLEFEHEAHGFLLEANRIRWYERLAAFFAEHLAPPEAPAP